MGKLGEPNLLRDARVYLSGPMDFVASREAEKKFGWRNRVSEFLREFGVTVFDPWFKPEIRGVKEYGREDETTAKVRDQWTFDPSEEGAKARANCADHFWPALHMDLRMVDTSDFVVAYVPTNIYSVGTPHEIILCRQQRKPVLFVSPPIAFPTLAELAGASRKKAATTKAMSFLSSVVDEVPIKENPDRRAKPVVHAADRRRALLRRLRICPIPGSFSNGSGSLWTSARSGSAAKTAPAVPWRA